MRVMFPTASIISGARSRPPGERAARRADGERAGRDEHDRSARRRVGVVGDRRARRSRTTKPNAIERPKVERRLHATRLAAITGSTISAAIRRIPTMRIETATVSAASTATTRLSRVTGTPATRLPSSSSTVATRPRNSSAIVTRAPIPSTSTVQRSFRVTVRIEPKRNWKRLTLSAPARETSTTPAAIPV